jgi:hypothetical protein
MVSWRQAMKDPHMLSDLEAFARKRIAADRYPDDYHFFRPFNCDACGVVPFEMTIEHHTGSRKGNFKGMILGKCAECGNEKRLFSYTGDHRKRLRVEKPVCKCGNASFLTGECELIESDEGILGVFDEGAVVGKCSRCDRNRTLVHTD